jgi:anhydro-N-acetylmuramic acid kinase
MAAGGQGAPLVPYADWALLSDPQHPRIIQNIGGIGNLTLVPPKGRLEQVIAFDTGPGNMVIDAVTSAVTDGKEKFDRNGRLASKGRIFEPLLEWCLQHPYLGRKPPKTTGREEFGEKFVQKFLKQAGRARLGAEDQVATATAFTAASIANAYREYVFPRLRKSGANPNKLQIIVGGGGAMNATLMRMLAEAFPFARVLSHKDVGMPNEAKEAVAFALLAFETLSGRPSNVPGATGARHPAILGKIVLP